MVHSTLEISAKTLSFAEYLVDKVEHGVRYELDSGCSKCQQHTIN